MLTGRDIPLDLFGGLVTDMAASDLPHGVSPDCQDVAFVPGAVKTRPGLASLFATIAGNPTVNYLKTYEQPNLTEYLLALDSNGALWQSNGGALSQINSGPGQAIVPGARGKSTTLFGREYLALGDGKFGLDIPRQYDGLYFDRVSQTGPGASPNVADSAAAGSISAGVHQFAVMFQTRQGYITKPSPPSSWTAAGSKQASVTNIPIGPPNVVARILVFTAAGGAAFYYTAAMIVADNITTSATIDFSDAALQSGTLATSLFNQLELGECSGAIGYASRLFWWGERNKVANLLNPTFDGGFAGGAASASAGPANCGAGADGGGNTPWSNPGNIAVTSQSASVSLAGSISTSQGPNAVGAGADGGDGFTAWSSPDNITLDDSSSPAHVSLNPNGVGQSNYLLATGFGFSLPSNATINGIRVSITRAASVTSRISDLSLLIIKGGTKTGTDHAALYPTTWPNTYQTADYGNSSDLWGTTWTPADINASDFGVALQVAVSVATTVANVIYLQITVDYSVPGQSSNPLQATSFGFAVPSNATIAGIVATIKKQASAAGTIADASVLLLKAGVAVGIDHADGSSWQNSFTADNYGNSGDLWGVPGGLQPSDVNASNFGVQIQAKNIGSSTQTASIQAFVTMTVYYTAPTQTNPLGWTQGAAFAGGGSASQSGLAPNWGDAYAITGDGATAKRGEVNQSAHLDYLGVSIIAAATSYRVRARMARNSSLNAGTVHINAKSASGGFTTSGLAVNAVQLTQTYAEFDAPLVNAMTTVPSDLLVQIYADGTPNNGGVFLVDSVEVYPASEAYNATLVRASGINNPESYDGVNGLLQLNRNAQRVCSAFVLTDRSSLLSSDHLYFVKENSLYRTQDNSGQPATWDVPEVSGKVGTPSADGCDVGEDWAVILHTTGLYLMSFGQEPEKISQEIQPIFDAANWQYGHTAWVRVDTKNKRILVGLPMGAATSPNQVLVLDYRGLISASQILDTPPVHFSTYSGKMLAIGHGRKWAPWNISANCAWFEPPGTPLAVPSAGAGGLFLGNGSGKGKIYQLSDSQLSDDGAAINSYYVTCFFLSAVLEEQYQLGAHRKLFDWLTLFAEGSGSLALAAYADGEGFATLLPSLTLASPGSKDLELPINIIAERAAFKVGTNAAGSWFKLQKFTPNVSPDPNAPLRGVN